MPLEIEGRYPGIKTGEVVGVKVDTARGDSAWMRFFWVAPDSPVTDLAEFDTSKHADVVVDATASSNGRFSQTPGFVARLGEPATATVAGLGRLQLTATAVDASSVELKLQAPSLPPGMSVPTRRLPESFTVRAEYGHKVAVDIEDINQRPWTIVLQPQRVEPGIR